MIVGSKASIWVLCSEGLSGPLGWPCAICSHPDPRPALSVCVWLDRGHVVRPTELGGAKNHESIFPYVYFLRRTHVGFVDSPACPRDWQVAASTWRQAAESGLKVTFRAEESPRVGAEGEEMGVGTALPLGHTHIGNCTVVCFPLFPLPTSYLCMTGLDFKLLCLFILWLGACEGPPVKRCPAINTSPALGLRVLFLVFFSQPAAPHSLPHRPRVSFLLRV